MVAGGCRWLQVAGPRIDWFESTVSCAYLFQPGSWISRSGTSCISGVQDSDTGLHSSK